MKCSLIDHKSTLDVVAPIPLDDEHGFTWSRSPLAEKAVYQSNRNLTHNRCTNNSRSTEKFCTLLRIRRNTCCRSGSYIIVRFWILRSHARRTILDPVYQYYAWWWVIQWSRASIDTFLRIRIVVRRTDQTIAKTFQYSQPRHVKVTQECLSVNRVKVRAWQHGLFSHGARPREGKVSITVNRADDWLCPTEAWACTEHLRMIYVDA